MNEQRLKLWVRMYLRRESYREDDEDSREGLDLMLEQYWYEASKEEQARMTKLMADIDAAISAFVQSSGPSAS